GGGGAGGVGEGDGYIMMPDGDAFLVRTESNGPAVCVSERRRFAQSWLRRRPVAAMNRDGVVDAGHDDYRAARAHRCGMRGLIDRDLLPRLVQPGRTGARLDQCDRSLVENRQ